MTPPITRPKKSNAAFHRHAGFSLVELVVAVACIAILIAFIFAGQKKAKAQAGLAHCASNLRQIAVGFHLYNGENDGTFPPHWGVADEGKVITWYGFIAPYIAGMARPEQQMSKIFHCPTNPRPITPDINYLSTARNTDQSYGYNYSYLTSNPEWSRKIRVQTVADKTRFVLVGDIPTFGQESDIVLFPENAGGVRLYPAVTPAYAALNGVSQRHGGGANFLFLDGHVEFQNSRIFAREKFDSRNWVPVDD